MHVEVVVDGRTARVHVDHAAQPQLTVTDLKRPWASRPGRVVGKVRCSRNFSNVTVTPSPAGPASGRARRRARFRFITRWALGPWTSGGRAAGAVCRPFPLDATEAEPADPQPARFRRAAPALVASPLGCWRARPAERAARTVRLAFGYSDAVTIF